MDLENLASCAIIVLSAWIIAWYALRPDVFRAFPLSTITMLAFNFTTLTGALVFQTVSWRSVIYNLEVPITAFAMLTLAQLGFLIGHTIYRKLFFVAQIPVLLSKGIIRPLGGFEIPTNLQLWAIGILGLASMVGSRIILGAEIQTGNVIGKFFQALSPLMYLPYLIPFLHKLDISRSTPSSPNWLMLVGYTASILVFTLMINARAVFVLAPLVFITVFYLCYLLGIITIPRKAWPSIIISTPFVLISGFLLLDLSTAMLVARAQRGAISPTELAALTVESFFDKNALQRYEARDTGGTQAQAYSEAYFRTGILGRFVTTKFHDNMFFYSRNFTDSERKKLTTYTYNRTVAILPQPAINLLGLNVRKDFNAASMGDFTYYLGSGDVHAFGGQRTGSAIQNAISIFGFASAFVFPLMAILISIAIDAFRNYAKQGLLFSPIILTSLIGPTASLSLESITGVINFSTRGLAQSIILYAAVFFIMKIIFPGKPKAPRIAPALKPTSLVVE